jgi:hypothetical protein
VYHVKTRSSIIVGIIIINHKKIIEMIIMEETRRCIYCDKKFIVDQYDDEYKCQNCRKNNITYFIANKW